MLANLTGWELASIRTKMQLDGGDAKPADRPWYETIWRRLRPRPARSCDNERSARRHWRSARGPWSGTRR
ncbi:MAG: hypothetical protein U0610_08770 [bacterium]